MTATRPHWSYSALNQYLRCPLQYYFERILKLPQTTVGSGLVLGSAVHSALACYHEAVKNGDQVRGEDLHSVILSAWESRADEVAISYKSGESREELISLGVALLDVYLNEPPPESIVAVEQRVMVPLHGSNGEYLETPLVAVADLITREPEGLKVNEFKTSGRAFSEFEVESSLQATCYANAAWETFGEWVHVEFAVLVKTKTPKLQRVTTTRTEDDFGRLGDLVAQIEQAVSIGIFYPVETPLNCSTCPYRGPCREWKPDQNSWGQEQRIELVELGGIGAC